MTEITQRDYNVSEVARNPMVVWVRRYFGSFLYFYPEGRDTIKAKAIPLQRYEYATNIQTKGSIRYYILTDEDVERMILPRII